MRGASVQQRAEPRAAGFPFLFGGTFIEGTQSLQAAAVVNKFPFLFGGTFIEGRLRTRFFAAFADFPSFSEGLSLRDKRVHGDTITSRLFPFLFGGTFIEGFGS